MREPLKVSDPSGLIGKEPLSMFKGIFIFMHLGDEALKNTPHFYAQFEDEYVIYAIPDGDILKGDLPRNKKVLIEGWLVIHEEEMLANWKLLQRGEALYQIQPLR